MKYYQCIVVGAGHAGIEAALAASRMGCTTLMVNLSAATIGEMSCNPAIGGVGKGQLVKEIDALGGEMAKAADQTGIQFRQLNASKGAAVRSSRCQSDRAQYRAYMRDKILAQPGLIFLEDHVNQVLVHNGRVRGICTERNEEILAQAVILTPGTFLNGRIHIGLKTFSAGRIHEANAVALSLSLKDCGFRLMSFKTGTPPRLDGRTIDFTHLVRQDSDQPPIPFSFTTKQIPAQHKLLPCFVTTTNEGTHDIIRENLHQSPMYSGRIQSTGVRYCPSIEDKIVRFAQKKQHHVFLEPEGLGTSLYYPNGISTGLPEEVQTRFVHSIQGLERATIMRFGYSIEHDVIDSTQLKPTLESKHIGGLFSAGQINGTTGYEEAAAQGLMAGINAALSVKGEEPFVLGREEAYIGVLIDDLITKGTQEPYRMFTSRVEYRLVVREDNADKRLSHYAYPWGLISEAQMTAIKQRYDNMVCAIDYLKRFKIEPGTDLDDVLQRHQSAPLRHGMSLSNVLKRPEVTLEMLAPWLEGVDLQDRRLVGQIEYEIKYEGFVERQKKDIEKFRFLENIRIPEDFSFEDISGLSTEIKQKLKHFSPVTLGQAHRISGVTPAAISVLMVYLRKRALEKTQSYDS